MVSIILRATCKQCASMLDHQQYKQRWTLVLLLFQLLGYTTHSTVAGNRHQYIRRLVYPVVVLVVMTALSVYVILTKVSPHVGLQINIIADETVYLSIMTAQSITLFESLCRRALSVSLFEETHAIAIELWRVECTVHHDPAPITVDFVRICRRMLLKNWLQVIFSVVTLSVGCTLTGLQSWLYFRWILLTMIMMSVRLMECTMHVELIGELLGAVERIIASVHRARLQETDQRRILHGVIDAYSRIQAQAHRISVAFSWSLFAILVYAMNATVTAVFWFVFAMYTGALKK